MRPVDILVVDGQEISQDAEGLRALSDLVTARLERDADAIASRVLSSRILMKVPDSRPSTRILTEDNAKDVLEECMVDLGTLFGSNPESLRVGITGRVDMVELSGPVLVISLSGRFWHRSETVIRNARAYLMNEIPELSDVELADPDDELDTITDEETGAVIEDRRSPDWNGDRGTLEYQGIDPDTRGPFPKGTGGFRAGGSMFS